MILFKDPFPCFVVAGVWSVRVFQQLLARVTIVSSIEWKTWMKSKSCRLKWLVPSAELIF